MPSWHDINKEIRTAGSNYDIIRRNYLKKLHTLTRRNIIIYYSGWLQRTIQPQLGGLDVNDADKNGFMTVIHELDRSKGLDLFLHTPGGAMAATESLVDYLRQMFGTDIRVIVPQLAMSAGTMIACAAKSILMGAHSSLGPIDPQIGGIPAHGIVEEFTRACREIKDDPTRTSVWQVIFSKYHPTFIGECEKAIQWANEMVKEWLITGMLEGQNRSSDLADKIVEFLGDHALTKSHSRHLSAQNCKDIGLEIEILEDDPKLQDAVLSVHHACIHTLAQTGATKIIENHKGVAFISLPQSTKQIHPMLVDQG